ncbi:RagB/SusD family nutrient uptake outer membrane protein [Pedobacter chitinilyticus]|uniref:RagB/SusD family nutrient uptake outer membrane protein n=1 Tax=Pedobacter chitinilyticus TaxID=2233776 RepID=A0A443Z2R6_9SPHI|nr:RagB/SusD family nutrient uptake outer membrane protein [Pedobacter chitinilyticus]RWU10837.1 RagB/SusD family nutrient uptake outer membrane protein [Pedobacter chitinilyticus]
MKSKIFYFKGVLATGLLVGLLCITSCKKALDADPYSTFTSANFFNDTNEAYMATLGVYEIMSSLDTYGWYIPQVFDNDTDIGQVSGDTSDEWRMVPHYKGAAGTAIFYTVWSALYKGIDRANVVIEKIPQMSQFTNGTAAEKTELNRMLGEAKFLRGFYYSELVRFWGDVPFKTKSSQTGDNLKLGLTDRYVIYTQVIKDMEEAAELLPATLPTNERINKWAAKAMLARVALFAGGYSLRADGQAKRPDNYKEYYQLAQKHINDVIGSTLYKLNTDYTLVFKNQCQHKFEPTENLFEVAFYNPSGNRGNASYIGIWNGVQTANGVYGSVAARCVATRTFYNSFQTGDIRRDFSIATYNINAAGARVPLTGNNDQNWSTAKWSREYQVNTTTTERQYTHINYVVLRYSDVLLMRAEVENELNNGPNQLAYEAINTVRRRGFGKDLYNNRVNVTLSTAGTGYTAIPTVTITGGGGTGATATATISSGRVTGIVMTNFGANYTSVPTVTITGGNGTGATAIASIIQPDLPTGLNKDDFFTAVFNERAFELAFEGMRRSDLVRWNKLATKIKETNDNLKAIRSTYFYVAFANFVPGRHELYPLPQNELDVNKSITRQNPNY